MFTEQKAINEYRIDCTPIWFRQTVSGTIASISCERQPGGCSRLPQVTATSHVFRSVWSRRLCAVTYTTEIAADVMTKSRQVRIGPEFVLPPAPGLTGVWCFPTGSAHRYTARAAMGLGVSFGFLVQNRSSEVSIASVLLTRKNLRGKLF
jgi:hypothetical protein